MKLYQVQPIKPTRYALQLIALIKRGKWNMQIMEATWCLMLPPLYNSLFPLDMKLFDSKEYFFAVRNSLYRDGLRLTEAHGWRVFAVGRFVVITSDRRLEESPRGRPGLLLTIGQYFCHALDASVSRLRLGFTVGCFQASFRLFSVIW